MAFYTDDEKYVRQYLEHQFAGCNIDEIMQWVEEEYVGNINIEVENDEWIRGDEDLMDFIQCKLFEEEEELKQIG
tara:strand:+ start:396 stop:620 length:225 start_codon:yes stop_codon:yes gene_type:complete